MLTLDGSTLEGGGQLTRMALCLSAITGIHLKVHSIRAGRGSRSLRTPQDQGKYGSGQHVNSQHTRKGDRKGDRRSTTVVSNAKIGGGLKESHLAALYWLAQHCHADVDGDRVGSREVLFRPARNPTNKQFDQLPIANTIELQNPGSVWLIFQAIFPFMVFNVQPKITGMDMIDTPTPVYDITLKGGTNVPKSMASEYVQQVFLPICTRIGLPRTDIEIVKRGWTTGKSEIGQVRIKVYPPQMQTQTHASRVPGNETSVPSLFILPAFSITNRGAITSISITLLTSSPSAHLKLSTLLTTSLLHHPTFHTINPQPTISIHPTSSTDSGDPRRLYILLVAHTSNDWILGRDYLGPGSLAKNSRQEDVMLEKAAGTVVRDLMDEIVGGGCVDEFMADQLVVFQALAEGTSVVDGGGGNLERSGDGGGEKEKEQEGGDQAGSLHTRTVRWVCEEVLGRYGVKFEQGGRCRGIGWNAEGCKLKDDQAMSGFDVVEE